MFKKFVERMVNAQTEEDIVKVLYSEDGVDRMFQKGKITWKEHELLFALAGKLTK